MPIDFQHNPRMTPFNYFKPKKFYVITTLVTVKLIQIEKIYSSTSFVVIEHLSFSLENYQDVPEMSFLFES